MSWVLGVYQMDKNKTRAFLSCECEFDQLQVWENYKSSLDMIPSYN